jgi:hypothetical protein
MICDHPVQKPESMTGYTDEDRRRVYIAIKTVCPDDSNARIWVDNVLRGEWHALAALILVHLPNLRELDIFAYDIPDPLTPPPFLLYSTSQLETKIVTQGSISNRLKVLTLTLGIGATVLAYILFCHSSK